MLIVQTQNDCNTQSHLLLKLKTIVLYAHTIIKTQNNCTVQSYYC